mgnify:CR=1 FL=1
MTPAWALPALLRALRLGPPRARARTLRLLRRADPGALQAEPAAGSLRDLLRGADEGLARVVIALVARRGLAAFAGDLVPLLRQRRRRGAVLRALSGRRLRPPSAALLELALDEQAGRGARRAALRLLRSGPLEREELLRLVACLAEPTLHEAVLPLLEELPQEEAIAAAVAANRARGEALLRRRGQLSWLRRLLLPPRPSSLGEWPGLASEQRGFRLGIAHLALASARWLPALVPALFETPALTRALCEGFEQPEVRERVAPLLLERLGAWGLAPEQRVVLIETLGRCQARQATAALRRWLPRYDGPAGPEARAALVALGRLGDEGAVAPFLAGALLGVEQALGRLPAEAGAPAHPSCWTAALLAGAHLGQARVGELALRLLRAERPPPGLDEVLEEALALLRPLELEPTIEALLGAEQAREPARRIALALYGRLGVRRLQPLVVALPRRAPALAAAAVRVEAGCLTRTRDGDQVGPALELIAAVAAVPPRPDSGPGLDEALRAFLLRFPTLPTPATRRVARAILEARAGGARCRRLALREALREEHDPAAVEAVLAAGLADPAHPVRLRALRVALRRGLLAASQAAAPGREGLPGLLPRLPALLCEALQAAGHEPAAARQVELLLRGPARPLRPLLRGAGGWREAAPFHGLHRELLAGQEAAAARGQGPRHTARLADPLGLAHAALLLLLGRVELREPHAARRGPYVGPLPRLERARGLASPLVQAALEELVLCSPGYARGDALLGSFLGSPRARARVAALGGLSREGTLLLAEPVLARLGDAEPAVRRAAVDLLQRHELARFAPALRPLLEDPQPAVRLAAGRALAAWGDRSCLGLLAGFLEVDDAALRREALGHLTRAEPEDAAPRLAPLLSPERPRAAAAALCALRPGRLADHAPLRAALLELCERARGPLRAAALRFLPELARGGAAERCLPLLLDPDPRVAEAAATALVRAGARRLAPAVSERALQAGDGPRRLLLLGLLAQLDAPEAARGLLPLLLCDEPAVRVATRQALRGARGFSLGPALAALLREGLSGGRAGAPALAELVALLDREGDDEAVLPALVEALRCEERAVWSAALLAARGRRSDALAEPLWRLIEAEPPPPAPLLTLALDELARCRLHRARPAVVALLRRAERETVRRKALEVARALEVPGESEPATALAREAARQAHARAEAALAAVAPGLLARLSGRDRRDPAKVKARRDAVRAVRQLRGTTSHGQRLALEEAPDLAGLQRALQELPPPVGTVPWRARARAAELLAASPLARLSELPAATPALEVVRALLDRVPPARAAELLDALPAAAREQHPTWGRWLLARLRAHRPPPGAELLDRAALDRLEGLPYARLLLGAAEGLDRGLAAQVPALIARTAQALEQRRISSTRAPVLLEGLARARLRLGVQAGREGLLPWCQDELGLRILAADGDVAALAQAFRDLHGTNRAGERREVIELLGEVGEHDDGQAARAIAGLVGEEPGEHVRAAGAAALGACGAGEVAAREALVRLAGDERPGVRAAALLAAGGWQGQSSASAHAADERALGGAILSGLESAFPQVQAAAAEAAARRGLRAARPALHAALRAATPATPHAWQGALARALLELGGPEDADEALARLREGRAVAEVRGPLVELLVRHLPDERLDQVGLLLGENAPAALVPALQVLGARGHDRAAPAVRALLAHPAGEVRAAAASALGQLGAPEEDAPRLRALAGFPAPGAGLEPGPTPLEPAPAGAAGEADAVVLWLESLGDQPRLVLGALAAQLDLPAERAADLFGQLPCPLPPLPLVQAMGLRMGLESLGVLVREQAGREARAAAPRDPDPAVRGAALEAAVQLLPRPEARALLLAAAGEASGSGAAGAAAPAGATPPAASGAALAALVRGVAAVRDAEEPAVGELLLAGLVAAAFPGCAPPGRDEPPARLLARLPGGLQPRRAREEWPLGAAALRALLRREDEQELALAWTITEAALRRPFTPAPALALLEPWLEVPARRGAALDFLREAAHGWWATALAGRARSLLVAHDPLAIAALEGPATRTRWAVHRRPAPGEESPEERLARAVRRLELPARRAFAASLRELLLCPHPGARREARAALQELKEGRA